MTIAPWAKYVAIGVVILLIVGGTALFIAGVFKKGEKAGAADVTTAVQKETIKQTDKARTDKEKADEKVRSLPADAVIDSTR